MIVDYNKVEPEEKKETSCRHFFCLYARQGGKHLRGVHESAGNDQAQTGIPCSKSRIHSVGMQENVLMLSDGRGLQCVRVYAVSFCTATLSPKVCNQEQMKWK